jgi:hypothetical protein
MVKAGPEIGPAFAFVAIEKFSKFTNTASLRATVILRGCRAEEGGRGSC